MTDKSPKHTADDVIDKAADTAHDLADKAGVEGDVKKTVDRASDAAKDAAGTASDVAEDIGRKVEKTADDVVMSARDFADEGSSRIRSAYEDNPTRFVTVAALAGAAVIALVVALAKRS
ncbi:hypothetical protein ASF06_03700 [Agreia sp. Leaf244]|uniref:hypothetical protein n=1 Tax=Agreia sp. Leaf244 TaxID=1736305 RepID=UPI0006F1C6FC|nr:hypothetical protein [Agreia sp. Leaf244]KQO11736.1 hypothetical protein ASF06_03700 [Agreia sp. Leaf244]